MIEGVATASTANQNHPETVQPKVEVPVETTPDVAEGKVNPVDNVEDPSSRAGSDQHPDAHRSPTRNSAEGSIVDLLG